MLKIRNKMCKKCMCCVLCNRIHKSFVAAIVLIKALCTTVLTKQHKIQFFL